MKPGTDERDAEKAVRDAIEKVETEEHKPGIEVQPVRVPLSVVEDGDTAGESAKQAVGPDGQPAGMRGRVITSLSRTDVYQERIRRLKPCISCVHLWFPKRDTQEWGNRQAHLANAVRLGALLPGTTADEFGGCTVKQMWVQVSHSCGQHRFRGGWWSRVKSWVSRYAATGEPRA